MPRCRGSGPRADDEAVLGEDPAGAKAGTRVRLKGKGEAGGTAVRRATSSSSRVEPSPLYERRGADLVVDVPVTSGGRAGCVRRDPDARRPRLAEDPGRLREREAPARQGPRRAAPPRKGRGDLLARVKASVPTKLSKDEKEALEAYGKVSREDPRRERVRAMRADTRKLWPLVVVLGAGFALLNLGEFVFLEWADPNSCGRERLAVTFFKADHRSLEAAPRWPTDDRT